MFKTFGASDLLTGTVFSAIPSALILVIGPVVGYKSDRLRSKWGRRIPFLIIPTPLIVMSMLGLAYSPQLGAFINDLLGSRALDFNQLVLILMSLFWVTFEISCVTANTVFGGLINDVVPQRVIGRFFSVFRAFSLLAGIIFYFELIGHAESHYAWIFLGVGTLYGVGFTLMCLRVREGKYPTPAASHETESILQAARNYFRDGFSNSYYLLYFAFVSLAYLAPLPFNLYSIFYAKSIGMSMASYGRCLALTYAVSLLLAYTLGSLADRYHPLRVSIGALILYAIAMMWGTFFVKTNETFSLALIIHGILSGAFATTSASLGQRLLPSGKFTELSSAANMLTSISVMMVTPLLGLFLDHTRHSYRYTFHLSLILTLFTLPVAYLLHRRFVALGGLDHYAAP